MTKHHIARIIRTAIPHMMDKVVYYTTSHTIRTTVVDSLFHTRYSLHKMGKVTYYSIVHTSHINVALCRPFFFSIIIITSSPLVPVRYDERVHTKLQTRAFPPHPPHLPSPPTRVHVVRIGSVRLTHLLLIPHLSPSQRRQTNVTAVLYVIRK